MRTLIALHVSQKECSLYPLLQKILTRSPDILILSNHFNEESLNIKPIRSAKSFLGQSLMGVIFDARFGFSLDSFLCIAHAVRKGGVCILLHDDYMIDDDSARFHQTPIPTPNFNALLKAGLSRYASSLLNDLPAPHFNEPSDPIGLSEEQRAIRSSILHADSGIFTLFSPRGTGKSYLTVDLIQRIHNQRYAVTAPNQSAINQYDRIDDLVFYAPDELILNHKKDAFDLLIIEEAAQIPLSHLESLSKLAHKVLMISSIDNYEGTGKGLATKINDLIHIKKAFTLSIQHRFDAKDPLNQFCEWLQLNHREKNDMARVLPNSIDVYANESLRDFQRDLHSVTQFYHLMNTAHYQTNAQDIRRLLDAPSQEIVTYSNKYIQGGIWALEEGDLSQRLSLDVFRGLRRPKGNLVVQTLSAHSYYPELMCLSSLRVSRIAVDVHYRKQGIAKSMLTTLIQDAKNKGYDFISTSFGLTESLLKFWGACGFHWIHMGTNKDHVTGLHAAIMIYPISDEMTLWVENAKGKWRNDAFELSFAPFISDRIKPILREIGIKGESDELDQAMLIAHNDHKKPNTAVYSALSRKKRLE